MAEWTKSKQDFNNILEVVELIKSKSEVPDVISTPESIDLDKILKDRDATPLELAEKCERDWLALTSRMKWWISRNRHSEEIHDFNRVLDHLPDERRALNESYCRIWNLYNAEAKKQEYMSEDSEDSEE